MTSGITKTHNWIFDVMLFLVRFHCDLHYVLLSHRFSICFWFHFISFNFFSFLLLINICREIYLSLSYNFKMEFNAFIRVWIKWKRKLTYLTYISISGYWYRYWHLKFKKKNRKFRFLWFRLFFFVVVKYIGCFKDFHTDT